MSGKKCKTPCHRKERVGIPRKLKELLNGQVKQSNILIVTIDTVLNIGLKSLRI